MMRFAAMVSTSAAMVLLLLLFLGTESEAITCSDVVRAIKPCVQYLQSGNGIPPTTCCQGASALANSATTTADKQTACNCLKNASKSMKINLSLAQSLPGNCKISLPYPISPNVDCSTIR